jgi:hypothetical protein
LFDAGLNARGLLGHWNGKDAQYVRSLPVDSRKAAQICNSGNPFLSGYSDYYPTPHEVIFFKIPKAAESYLPKYAFSALTIQERLQNQMNDRYP